MWTSTGRRRDVPGFLLRARDALSGIRSAAPRNAAPVEESATSGMLGELGAILLSSSQACNDVEETLVRLSVRYGRPDLRVFVLPTVVLIEDPRSSRMGTAFFPAGRDALRLDQTGRVEHLVRRALDEQPPPDEIVAAARAIRVEPARFGAALSLLGYTLLTIGFGLVLNPTVTALPVYLVLGVVVGTIVLLGNRAPTLSLILPVATAFAVTLLITLLVRPIVHDDVLRLVAPSLVSFLPGLTLTIAAVELTSGQVMAGASRLVYGFARLGLLAFGVFAGISVGGTPPAPTVQPEQLGSWAPWVGIALVSVGYYFYSAAPRGSFPWILYALVVAYSAQLLGDHLLGPELSGMVGAVIVIPAVALAGRLRTAPATAIMLTCAYWLLVPGAMGFIGLSEAASGTSGATSTILRTFGSLMAIAIGMVIGTGLARDVSAFARGWRRTDAEKGGERDA